MRNGGILFLGRFMGHFGSFRVLVQPDLLSEEAPPWLARTNQGSFWKLYTLDWIKTHENSGKKFDTNVSKLYSLPDKERTKWETIREIEYVHVNKIRRDEKIRRRDIIVFCVNFFQLFNFCFEKSPWNNKNEIHTWKNFM